jgi:hypothetical protein
MTDISCEERLRLERAVIVAIQGLYAAESTARGSARIAERNAVKALQDHIELHGCIGSHGLKARAGLRSCLQQRHVALQTLQDAARVEQKVLNGIVEYLKSGGDCDQVAETLDSYLTGTLPDLMQDMWVVCVEMEALERRLSRLGFTIPD